MATHPRVFIGLYEIAGYLTRLSSGFRQSGIYSRSVSLRGHPFEYSSEQDCAQFISVYGKLASLEKRSRWAPLRLVSKITRLHLKLLLFIWTIFTFDVFIFVSFASFFGFRELPILKLLKKKIIFVFLGTDSRPTYISGNALRESGGIVDGKVGDLEWCREDVARKKRWMKKVERYADYCINHPASAHFHEKPFVLWYAIGYPFGSKTVEPQSGKPTENTIILHAPSKPESKGTGEIRRIISELREKGHRIELLEITGRPNAEVIRALQHCDMVVDELYSDTSLGALGFEGAFFGKVTVNGGYYAECISSDHTESMIPPSSYCLPEDLGITLEELLTNQERRKELGARAQQFVRGECTPKAVAMRYLRLIAGDFPDDWWFDPGNISYLLGYGLDAELARMVVMEYIGRFGVGALHVTDKPELEMKFLRFSDEAVE